MKGGELGELAASTLVEVLRGRAEERPEARAYIFLVDGELEEQPLTYGELDRRARAIGAHLQAQTAPGARVVLLYPPDLDYLAAFFGCLYAGVIAVPAYPPDPSRLSRTLPRLVSIVADAGAEIVLTTSPIAAMAEMIFSEAPALKDKRWLSTDALSPGLADEWRAPRVLGEDLAFLQYTSGSTGTPKGVMLSHRNLLHNLRAISGAFGITSDSIGVSWLPPYHDMGLIGTILAPLYKGRPTALMSPLAFLQRPSRWLRAISHYRATISGGPNFSYELCVRKVGPEERAGLDLSSWTLAFCGAEPVRPETLDRFVEAFGPCGFRRASFYPCYGLAEATLMVSGGLKEEEPVVRAVAEAALGQGRVEAVDPSAPRSKILVGCGRAVAGVSVVIVDPASEAACPPGQVGEIGVSGPSVAEGYWGQSEVTEKTFGAASGPKLLRTGDLGFLHEGELFVTGRRKDLIIIRGKNHYPQDIERTVEESAPALRRGCAAAFSVQAGGEERLVVAVEIEGERRRREPEGEAATPFDPDAIYAAVRRSLADRHALLPFAVVLLRAGSIPKTSSGKIQRPECRSAFERGALDEVGRMVDDAPAPVSAPMSGGAPLSVEEVLSIRGADRSRWLVSYLQAQVARSLKLPPEKVDPEAPINTFGLDSLMAVELTHELERNIGAILPVTSFLREVSLVELAERVLSQVGREASPTGAPSSSRQAAESSLSLGQEALWFARALDPESSAHHLSAAIRVRSRLSPALLRGAFEALRDRHPVLGARYELGPSGVLLRVASGRELVFDTIDVSGSTDGELERRVLFYAERPFDLEHEGVLRVGLFTRIAEEHVLVISVHHIAADLWSLVVLLKELRVLLERREELPPLELSYGDFARWQRELADGPRGEEAWAYFRSRLSGELPVLSLPTDRRRPAVRSSRGATHRFLLSAALTGRLRELARGEGATLFMVLLASFDVLLGRYAGQEDIIVGLPVAGRTRAGFDGVVGFFANAVPLRADLSGEPSFRAFLCRVRASVLDALEHQDYPFARLVERLKPSRDPGRTPIFQVMFAFEKPHLEEERPISRLVLGVPGTRVDLGPLALEAYPLNHGGSEFELTLMIIEGEAELSARIHYNTDLFDASRIEAMASHLGVLLEAVVRDPDASIGRLPLLTEAERREELVAWNTAAVQRVDRACLHELFEAQVERTPDAIASASLRGEEVSYRELNRRANRLARWLRRRGVEPESRVGIAVGRRPAMMVGLLGILKAGGAYVPLDPALPEERLAFMIEDAATTVLVTEACSLDVLRRATAHLSGSMEIVCLDVDTAEIERESGDNPARCGTPEDAAYVIYTSGSTGAPKGVLVEHGALVNYLRFARGAYLQGSVSGSLVHTSLTFDLTVTGLYAPLLAGGRVTLVPEEDGIEGLPEALLRFAEACLVKLTPAHLALLRRTLPVGEAAVRAHTFIVGGEALDWETLSFFHGRAAPLRIINEYGPTEAAVGCCIYVAAPQPSASGAVPIGRPIANMELYLLDDHMEPVPKGVIAELYIGGSGLARGYLGRPEKTAQRFLPNPFRADGSRLFRTGDLARRLASGDLEFVGRVDHQVKIRGFRVELGEIEARLRQHPEIRDAVVLAREDAQGGRQLVAYFVPAERAPLGASDLLAFLRRGLPEYMIPAAFVAQAELPLTKNGKVDRRALPAPDAGLGARETFVAPRHPVEEVFAAVWAEVLGLERVGIHDDFFALGGHSLLAVQVIVRLRDLLRAELPLRAMYDRPTVAALADPILHDPAHRAIVEAAELVVRVSEISEEEAERMLSTRTIGAPRGRS
jgi:amino acid adenylation domain-containing protein